MTAQFPHAVIAQPPLRVPLEALALPHHARRPVCHRLGNEVPAVASLPGIRDEGVARLERAAVVRQPPHTEGLDRFPVGGRQPAGCLAFGAWSLMLGACPWHHTSSLISCVPAAGSTTLSTGASGAVASMRSAPAITSLNTGAATAPP